MGRLEALRERLSQPVDVASLVAFRIVFGLAMFYEVARYFFWGFIERDYVAPSFHFTYVGFSWVHPWPGWAMYLHFYALGALALCVLIGFCYRASIVLFFLGFAYVFLLDEVYYLNHFYLITILAFLMAFVPAAGAFSVDAARSPNTRTDHAARWQLWLIRGQLALVYFYAGLAKLDHDWLSGATMRCWLQDTGDIPLLGRIFQLHHTPLLMSWCGLAFDLGIVPALTWRRTRPFAVLAACAFHGLNLVLFDIGVFPPLMLGATVMFFEPDWPRRVLGRVAPEATSRPPARPWLSLLALWFTLQLTVPFRYLLYPGNPLWTDEANRFSWWMLLRYKVAQARFVAHDPVTGQDWEVRTGDYLSRAQSSTIIVWPDMIQEFAHHAGEELERRLGRPVEVRAQVWCSLNGRKAALLVDPKVDLSRVPRDVWPAPWIAPRPGVAPPPQ